MNAAPEALLRLQARGKTQDALSCCVRRGFFVFSLIVFPCLRRNGSPRPSASSSRTTSSRKLQLIFPRARQLICFTRQTCAFQLCCLWCLQCYTSKNRLLAQVFCCSCLFQSWQAPSNKFAPRTFCFSCLHFWCFISPWQGFVFETCLFLVSSVIDILKVSTCKKYTTSTFVGQLL